MSVLSNTDAKTRDAKTIHVATWNVKRTRIISSEHWQVGNEATRPVHLRTYLTCTLTEGDSR
jgi:hypothetical protein